MPPLSRFRIPKRPAKSTWEKTDPPVYKDGFELRPYQVEGFNWLVFCWFQRRNSILADEMGLGKTAQSMSILDYLHRVQNIWGPFLVVAPLSTIAHWKREIERCTDMNTIVYHGSQEARDRIHEYEFHWRNPNGSLNKKYYKFNVLITTFETAMGPGKAALSRIPWRYLIVDEAHRLKNRDCKLINALREYSFDHTLLLTGTPLQNNTEELWSLLNFMEPSHFSNLAEFSRDYGNLQDSKQVQKLHAVLKSVLLRRVKTDVEKSVPPKEETIVEVELTPIQKRYYRAIYDKNFHFLRKGVKGSALPSLQNMVMELRKCCNHPFLINGAEEVVTTGNTQSEINEKLIQSSGKLVLVDKLLAKLRANGHKVLIFSQMVKVLNILEDYCHYRGYSYERIDGGIRGNDRQAAIDRFTDPSKDRFLFLLCTRAGGLGINLTSADTVIIYDSDWNPQNDVQAQARCHRIGQDKHVKVYRLITKNTYERYMFEQASKKLGLDQAVLQKMKGARDTDMGTSMGLTPSTINKQEIDKLLKFGAYDLFRDDNDEAASKFFEGNIDQILERASLHVKLDEGGQAQPSTFSKASFVSDAAAAENIDLMAPDFWERLMPEAANRPDPALMTEPRIRKAVQRWTPLDDLEPDADDDDAEELDGELYSDEDEGLTSDGWTTHERNAIRHALNDLGYGRWEQIRERAQISRWTVAQVAAFCRAIVKLALNAAEVPEKTEIYEALLNVQGEARNDPLVQDALIPLQKEEPPQVVKEGEASAAPGAPAPSEAAQTPAVEPPAPPAANPALPVPAAEAEVESKDISALSLNEFALRLLKEKTLSDVRFQAWLRTSAKPFLHRLIDIAQRGNFINSELWEKFLEAWDSHALGDAPASWWDKDCDRDFLLGTLKHGKGRYELIRTDPELAFAQRMKIIEEERAKAPPPAPEPVEPEKPVGEPVAADQEAKPEGKPLGRDELRKMAREQGLNGVPGFFKMKVPELRQLVGLDNTPARKKPAPEPEDENGWFSPKTLNFRLKRLTRACRLFKYKSEQEKKREARSQKKGEDGKKRVRGVTSEEWSKREKADFYRVMSQYGPPVTTEGGPYNWELMQDRASLRRKTLDMIEQYYVDFLTNCRHFLAKPYDSNQTTLEREGITLVQTKRVLERMRLFNQLRLDILPHPELDERLKRAQADRALPSWWILGPHDKAFLLAIAKHGFGQWDDVVQDPDLPFFPFLQEVRGNKPVPEPEGPDAPEAEAEGEEGPKKRRGPQLSDMINFPRDKIAMKRWEYLMGLVVPTTKTARRAAESTTPTSKKRPADADFSTPNAKSAPGLRGKVFSLGTVKDHPSFSNPKYIWPVGFTSVRVCPTSPHGQAYPSALDPETKVLYTSEILEVKNENGESVPLFRVTPEDNPDKAEQASSASAAWQQIIKQVSDKRVELGQGRNKNCSVSGPEYFGFGHATIRSLIEELPGAEHLKTEKKEPSVPLRRDSRPRQARTRTGELLDDEIEDPDDWMPAASKKRKAEAEATAAIAPSPKKESKEPGPQEEVPQATTLPSQTQPEEKDDIVEDKMELSKPEELATPTPTEPNKALQAEEDPIEEL